MAGNLNVLFRAVDTHESLVKYLRGLPTEVSHTLMSMSEANHRRKEEIKGKSFIEKLQNTK